MVTTPIIRPVKPTFNPGSGLRSPLDKDDLTNAHKKAVVPNGSTFNLATQVQQHTVAINKLRRRVLTPPQTQVQVEPQLSPFAIYKINPPPDGNPYAITFDESGNQISITIDSTVPTDFTAMPPTVNPRTDAWRFYQVRSGYVEVRPYFSIPDDFLLNYTNSYALLYPVFDYTDAVTPYGLLAGGTYGRQWDAPYKTTIGNNVPVPIVIPSNPSGDLDFDGNILFSLWLTIIPDADSFSLVNITLNGWRWAADVGGGYNLSPFPYPSPNIIQLGIIKSSQANTSTPPATPYDLVVDQMQSGHVVNRYSPGMLGFSISSANNPPGYGDVIPGALVYRGNWQDDASINDSVFYPGDFVSYRQTGRTILTTHTVTETVLLMCVAMAFTSDPITDVNFIPLNGYVSFPDVFGAINDIT